jgi:PST family polysaccharide transporter
VLGAALLPTWFFQGIEQMQHIVHLSLVTRVITTASTFLFVHRPEDLPIVPLFQSLATITAGIVGLVIVRQGFGVRFAPPPRAEVRRQLRDGASLFLSNIAVNFYTASNTFVLGLFTGNVAVGWYSAAHKIILAAQGLLAALSQSLYPHVSRLMAASRERALAFVGRMMRWTAPPVFVACALLLLFAGPVVRLVLGPGYEPAAQVLRVMAFLPFVILLSNYLGVQILLPAGMSRPFFVILAMASGLNLILLLFLVPRWAEVGASAAWLVVEIFVTAAMYFHVRARGLDPLRVRSDG